MCQSNTFQPRRINTLRKLSVGFCCVRVVKTAAETCDCGFSGDVCARRHADLRSEDDDVFSDTLSIWMNAPLSVDTLRRAETAESGATFSLYRHVHSSPFNGVARLGTFTRDCFTFVFLHYVG